MNIHVFAGPTITRRDITALIGEAICHPPIRHGDLFRTDPQPGDIVVILDGVFHQAAPVRHKEILEIMAHQVTVIGASSMGALRAAELDRYGMIGIGLVYQMYRDEIIDSDAEVALAHLDHEHDFRPISVALVSVRSALAVARATGIVDPECATEIIDHARAIDYPHRTWNALRRSLVESESPYVTDVDDLIGWLARTDMVWDVKRADAIAALSRAANCPRPEPDPDDHRRTVYVRRWLNRYQTVPSADALGPTRLELLRHAQLYDDRFPGLWRAAVLSRIGLSTAGPGEVRASAEDTALGPVLKAI